LPDQSLTWRERRERKLAAKMIGKRRLGGNEGFEIVVAIGAAAA
jgi:2-oxoglutarate dehydrogenase complex dehydrogenase (E1) component-like enzyme